MKKRLLTLVSYSLFWMFLFFFARFFFIITHFAEASRFSFDTIAQSFLHGLKLDISATGYILVLPFLLMVPQLWLSGNWYRVFMKWYTYLFIILAAAITVGDTVLYKYWGFRMDYTPFLYLSNPVDAAASTNNMQIIGMLIAVIMIATVFIILYNKSIDWLFGRLERVRFRVLSALILLVLCGSLIIPIRGGTGVAPINAGTVYFTRDMFPNHAAINVFWNVGSSAFNMKSTVNPYTYSDITDARVITDSLTAKNGNTRIVLNNSRPNILLIILESFGNALVGPLGGDPLTTPRLNEYIEEGIVFTNFYASGSRTDKALPAILSGYPAQPAVSIIKEPKKTQSLTGLVKSFDSLGYENSFWYGGDINFANFKSFLISSGFRQIITMNDFDPVYYNSKWGVHDHILFEALKDSMQKINEPFFNVVLTLSSHEPFEVPVEPVFKGKDDMTKFRNSIHYTDQAVGSFLDWAQGTSWWDNTLVILVADHCRRNSIEVQAYSPEIFRIPMVWLGGAVKEKGIAVDKLGCQVDISFTLLRQLGLKGDYYFAKDLLAEESNSFAFYTFNEGFAFITDTSAVIYDHKLEQPVYTEGNFPELAEKAGKAFLQVVYDDYLKR